MPIYNYHCKVCGKRFTSSIPISDYNKTSQCECGNYADHDIRADHIDGGVDRMMREYTFDGDGGTRMYAGAYLANQKEEAHRNHPGRDFVERNGALIPVIKHRQDKLQYLKEKSRATGQHWCELD